MKSLFRYLLRNHVIILFFLLEVLSLFFVFSFNNYQKVRFLNSSIKFSGNILNRYNKVFSYFQLSAINRQLADENARLHNLLVNQSSEHQLPDSAVVQLTRQPLTFSFVPAKVISNSINRQFNFITINKGRKDGIKPEQGIISVNGVVGLITNVSENYATGISLLNLQWNVSAKIKKNDYFGSLTWDGKNYAVAQLNEIPFHVNLAVGDTVVTSGYSNIFPEGIMLGTVKSFEKPGGENFYDIRINLSVDFKSLVYVEVIENHRRLEIENLEKSVSDGKGMD